MGIPDKAQALKSACSCFDLSCTSVLAWRLNNSIMGSKTNSCGNDEKCTTHGSHTEQDTDTGLNATPVLWRWNVQQLKSKLPTWDYLTKHGSWMKEAGRRLHVFRDPMEANLEQMQGRNRRSSWMEQVLEQKSNNQNIRSWLHKPVAALPILVLKCAGGKNAEDQLY